MIPKEQLPQTLSLIGETFEKNERIFNEIFEIAVEGITILDIETLRFVKCNGRAHYLLKYPAEKLLTMTALDICPELQPCGQRSEEKSMQLIARALMGEVVVCEWSLINGLGEQILVEVRVAVLRGYERPHLYTSFIDISERKQAEQRIAVQNKRLCDIAFLQSHQVRQPVANILGLINLFDLQDPANPINAEILMKLKTAARNFDSIIHDITGKATNLFRD
ncbi:MAG: sensor protein [Bacteroidetes bacterium]|jgi:PAS domain S-box-containing protein|nr:sensor protein [Bacteroidota bacterium]